MRTTPPPLEPTGRALGVAGTGGALNLIFSPLPSATARSSVFQQPLDVCHSFPASQGGGREPLPAPYQHQLSEPCPPYPQQSFKQEYLDPLYEQLAGGQGGVNGHRYPGAGVVIKQEQTDFACDSGKDAGAGALVQLLADVLPQALCVLFRFGGFWFVWG